MKRLIPFIISFLGLFSPALAVPNVVVSIKPIHSLVCAIMKGVGTPVLLMKENDSPHIHVLKPSEMMDLQQADVIIWIGDNYETAMRNSLNAVKGRKTVMTLMECDGLNKLRNRVGPLWGGEGHFHDHDHGHSHDHSYDWDGHIWLAPNNARAILVAVTRTLSKVDPMNTSFYEGNCKNALARMDELAQEMLAVLQETKEKTYVLYHDSTQYYDHYYGTQAVGAIVPEPGQSPSACHLDNLIQTLKTTPDIKCIFMEPQFDNKLVRTLSYESNIPFSQIDYIGIDLVPGEDAYYDMMRRLTNAIVEGLKGKGFKATASDAKGAKACEIN